MSQGVVNNLQISHMTQNGCLIGPFEKSSLLIGYFLKWPLYHGAALGSQEITLFKTKVNKQFNFVACCNSFVVKLVFEILYFF